MLPGLDFFHATAGGGLAARGISLDSWHFVVLAVVAVLLCHAATRSVARQLVLAALSACFLSFFLNHWSQVALLALLVVGTYWIGAVRIWLADRLPAWPLVLLVSVIWLALFLVKEPGLLGTADGGARFQIKLVGISYLMFRAIHYICDVETFEHRSLLRFANYMLFFPTLLAGPIERYNRFAPQLDAPDFQYDALGTLHRIANGAIKKFVLADNIAVWGIAALPDAAHYPRPLLWTGVLLQPLLLYLDFSGYCDIVIGLSRLMGFQIMENFNRPFLATNIQEFWNRWHISLTSFIRDYVFIPLGHFAIYRLKPRWHFLSSMAIYFLTMMLIALWHGVTWGFFVFGLLHGTALVGYQIYRRSVAPRLSPGVRTFINTSALATWSARAATYCFLAITMLFWKMGVTQSWHILQRLVGL
ncbi:MAG: hypothetical protein K8T25_22510 [Planctomycetia bacterium]|nr:hypothetical protein [Planctomycetia bacterium]